MELHKFKEDFSLYDRLEEQGIRIKCVIPCDITPVHDFIEENFTKAWADEALPAMMNGSCYIAVTETRLRCGLEEKRITLYLTIDENICTMYEYFDIFLQRMTMCSQAARIFDALFSLKVNGQRVL